MTKLKYIDGIDIVITGVLSFFFVFLAYWLCGGDFERNWRLGATFFIFCGIWGHLLQKKEEKAETRKEPKPSTLPRHETEYL